MRRHSVKPKEDLSDSHGQFYHTAKLTEKLIPRDPSLYSEMTARSISNRDCSTCWTHLRQQNGVPRESWVCFMYLSR